MTVKDIQRKLSRFDPDAEVVVDDGGYLHLIENPDYVEGSEKSVVCFQIEDLLRDPEGKWE